MEERSRASRAFSVWLDEKARVASFHPIESGRALSFRSHEHFMEYLSSLQQRGFRFQ